MGSKLTRGRIRRSFSVALIVFFLPLLGGCDDEETTPETITRRFFENAAIKDTVTILPDSSRMYFFEIKAGDNLVFEYEFVAAQDERITDDEYVEKIVFEVNNDLQAFALQDEALREARCFFMRSCFCADFGSHPVEQGSIIGKKLNDRQWLLEIDLTALGRANAETYQRKSIGIFQKSRL